MKELMNEWGRNFLRDRGYEVADDAEIDFDDRISYGGYCETCSYEEYVVDVSDGKVTGTYAGGLGELIRAMQDGVFY